MITTAAEDPSGTLLALTIAVIGLAGTVLAAIAAAAYTKWHDRKERRTDELARAVETFEARCDDLEDEYAQHFTAVNAHGTYGSDLGSVTAAGRPWSSVHRSVEAVERKIRPMQRFDKALAGKARAVHASLQEEIVLAQGFHVVDPTEHEDYLTTWKQRTETSKQLRDAFSAAAAERT